MRILNIFLLGISIEIYIFSAILCHYRDLTAEHFGEEFPAMT